LPTITITGTSLGTWYSLSYATPCPVNHTTYIPMANSPAKQLAISQINALCYFWPHLLVLFSLPNCLNPDLLDLGMGRMDVRVRTCLIFIFWTAKMYFKNLIYQASGSMMLRAKIDGAFARKSKLQLYLGCRINILISMKRLGLTPSAY